MEIINAIQNRRATRRLSAEAVPDELLARLLAAGSLAPSCYNNQPWRVLVCRNEILAELKTALPEGNAWALAAPAIVALAVRTSDDCRLDDGRDYAYFDAGLFAMNLMTQATADGLVAHPIAGYAPAKAKKILGIPKDYVLLCLIVVGRPGEDSVLNEWQQKSETSQRSRKPEAEYIAWGSWPWQAGI